MIVKIFINEEHEDERALYDLTNNKVILKGDYYHDKIYEQIKGFIYAMKYFGIEFSQENDEWIEEDHSMFKTLGFYN